MEIVIMRHWYKIVIQSVKIALIIEFVVIKLIGNIGRYVNEIWGVKCTRGKEREDECGGKVEGCSMFCNSFLIVKLKLRPKQIGKF